jgi:hypothetical protein
LCGVTGTVENLGDTVGTPDDDMGILGGAAYVDFGDGLILSWTLRIAAADFVCQDCLSVEKSPLTWLERFAFISSFTLQTGSRIEDRQHLDAVNQGELTYMYVHTPAVQGYY